MSTTSTTPLVTEAVADRARTIVVPVANPETAPDLLRLARAILPTSGGRIVATHITTSGGDAEERREHVQGLRDLVSVIGDRLAGVEVTLRTREASSIARGILDAVRDTGADALVLGLVRDPGTSRVAAILASVLEVVRCDVFLLHRAQRNAADEPASFDDLQRIVAVPTGSPGDAAALQAAIRLSNQRSTPAVIVRAAGIDTTDLQASVKGGDRCERLEVDGDLLDHLDEITETGDLVVIGAEPDGALDALQDDMPARALLERPDVGVVVVARHPPSRDESEHLLRRALAWLHPTMTDVERDSVRDNADGNAALTLDFFVMMVLSATIATYGMLLNSAAVIIGAMLVAPLMAPIQSFGVGVVDGRLALARRAGATVVLGTLVALVVGTLIGLSADDNLTSEVTSRGSPSLRDAAVAIAAGLAGAYATARKGIPAALAGVAIAAALVPPLGAAGIGLALGRWSIAFGALLLFTINIVCIAVASTAVFRWLGLRPGERGDARDDPRPYLFATAVALVVTLALAVAMSSARPTLDRREVRATVAAAGPYELLDVIVVREDNAPTTVRVVVVVPSDLDRDEALDDLREPVLAELRREFGAGVRVVLVPVTGEVLEPEG